MQKYRYSANSTARLMTCVQPLRDVFQAAIATGLIDITILDGRRRKLLQDQYFTNGMSRVKWPDSKHNTIDPDGLAEAVDAGPFVRGRVSWNKIHCIFLAGVVMACAANLGVKIRWGGNWDMDGEPVTDQDFQDLVHFESVD